MHCIVFFTGVNDHRYMEILRQHELRLESLTLMRLFFGVGDPIIVQADLADGDDPGALLQGLRSAARARPSSASRSVG